MPLETLRTLQDLEITGTEGPQQDETQYEPVETDGQQPAQTFHPSAPHPHSQAHSQAHPLEQPHSAPFYPPLLNSFPYDSNNTLPIDPGLLGAPFDHSAASGPGGGGVAGFQQGPWASQPGPPASMGGFMTSPTPLAQYNSSMPLVPGMSSFEPMVSTTWSMDGSLPSASTSSRGPTMSSSMSVPSTSTPASSKSPSSPGMVSTGIIELSAASKEALPNHPGMQLEARAEHQPNKKRRQASVPKAPQVPIAPAPTAVAGTSDDNEKNINKRRGSSISSSGQHQTTTNTTRRTTTTTKSNAGSGSPQPGPSTQPTTLTAAQQPSDPRARNREAANRCRAKSKVAVAELEATERAVSTEHEALTQTARSLRDEVLALKNELLMHGNCDDDVIQQYLANSARMVGSGALGTTVTSTTTNTGGGVGLPIQQPPPGPVPPGPPLVVPPGAGGSSARAMMPSASDPRMMPGMPPSSSAPGAGMTAPRGHQKGSGGGGGAWMQ